MSAPKSSATIEFPASAIDAEVRDYLKDEGVKFKPQIFGPKMELDVPADDLETEIDEDGIFRLCNPEARYGEFVDLEEVLIKKGIPFDRESRADWQRPAELRVFRPGDATLDFLIPQDPDFCGLEAKIRELIRAAGSKAVSEIPVLQDIENSLNQRSPSYPPLCNYLNVEAKL
jgi:hypothetical protein